MGSAANLMETRLITINSTQRTSVSQSTTNFSVDLLNAVPEIRDRVVGVSVETVGFVNYLNNVTAATSRLLVEYNDGVSTTTYIVTIPPGSYNYGELAYVIALEVNATLSLTNEFTAIDLPENVGQPAVVELSYVGPGYINLIYDRQSAAFPLGLTETIQLNTAGGPISHRPNLYGPLSVKLYTQALCGSRASVDGNGNPAPVIMTIPITSSYGEVQSMHMVGENRPTILYGHGSSRDLSNIDVSLRHLDGGVIDIGTGEMFVSFRVWLSHV